jgi:hypothetical protein
VHHHCVPCNVHVMSPFYPVAYPCRMDIVTLAYVYNADSAKQT